MKRYVSLLVAVVLLLGCFSLGVSADEVPEIISFSYDYRTLYVDGLAYSRFNSDILYTDSPTRWDDFELQLSFEQQREVEEITLQTNWNRTAIYACIAFQDGSELYADFLVSSSREDYEKLIDGRFDKCYIDFEWWETGNVDTSYTALTGTPVTLSEDTLAYCSDFPVRMTTDDRSLIIQVGWLLMEGEKYYYVDYEHADIELEYWEAFHPWEYTSLAAYEITDETLLAALAQTEADYYGDFELWFEGDIGQLIALVFLTLIFGIVPLALFILFLIRALRARPVYKEMYTAICVLALAVVVIFIVTTLFILLT